MVQQHTFNFLSEQLTLLLFHPKGVRHSIEMLISAFACLDRSGLIYPSILLFNIIQCSHSIFNNYVCVFQFGVDHQKQNISNTDDF